jgi:hypothetical protein
MHTDLHEARELDARTADGIEVRLLWHELTGNVFVHVLDSRTREEFAIVVDGGRALDVFHYPYAYTGRVGGEDDLVSQLQVAERR